VVQNMVLADSSNHENLKPHDPNSKGNDCYYIIISFRNAEAYCKGDISASFDRLVSLFTKDPIHCDLIPSVYRNGCSSEPITRKYYTSYMTEKFSKNDLTQSLISRDENYHDMALPISESEFTSICDLLQGWVEQGVTYNYGDLPLAAGLLGNGRITRTLFPDTCNPKTPGKLFCSQAVILCLRHCLKDKRHDARKNDLLEILAKTNCRSVSPRKLMKILQPFCHWIKRSSLDKDSIVFD